MSAPAAIRLTASAINGRTVEPVVARLEPPEPRVVELPATCVRSLPIRVTCWFSTAPATLVGTMLPEPGTEVDVVVAPAAVVDVVVLPPPPPPGTVLVVVEVVDEVVDVVELVVELVDPGAVVDVVDVVELVGFVVEVVVDVVPEPPPPWQITKLMGTTLLAGPSGPSS